MTAQAESAPDNAGVIARPPLIVLGTFGLGLALQWLLPVLCLVSGAGHRWLGAALGVAGVSLMAWAIRTFRAAGTHVETWRPTQTIVTRGPYGWSRNPIYVAMLLIYVGLGMALDALYVLALALPLFIVLRLGVIAREERYLERKFGQEYLAYKARVRRWF